MQNHMPRCDFDHPPPSSAKVEGRVELYIFSPSGTSWSVLGCTLPLLLPHFQTALVEHLSEDHSWHYRTATLPVSWQTITSVDTDTAFIQVTVHGKTPSVRWTCLVECRGPIRYTGRDYWTSIGPSDRLLYSSQTENVRGFAQWASYLELSVILEGVFSGWIVESRHSPSRSAHAHLSHSRGDCSWLWTYF